MTITVYTCDDDPRTINKSFGSGIEISGVRIKDDTSILNPVLDIAYNSSHNIFTKNYVYIPEFSRYYFIDNIVVSENRVFIHCRVDVLKSYENDIMAIKAFVMRQKRGNDTAEGETSYYPNLLLPDNEMPVSVKRVVSVDKDGSMVAETFQPVFDFNTNNPSYVMLINGGSLGSP